jgi:hypothetical protein
LLISLLISSCSLKKTPPEPEHAYFKRLARAPDLCDAPSCKAYWVQDPTSHLCFYLASPESGIVLTNVRCDTVPNGGNLLVRHDANSSAETDVKLEVTTIPINNCKKDAVTE